MIVMARNHYDFKLLLYNLNSMLVLFVFFYSVQQGNILEQKYLFQYKKKLFSVQKMLFPVRKYYFQSNTSILIQIHGEIQTRKKSESQMGFESTTVRDLLEFTFHIMLFLQYKPFYSQYKNINPSTIFFPVQKYSILV